MRGFRELLSVMRDAWLEDNTPALATLSRELSGSLGAAEAGMDRAGVWIRLEAEWEYAARAGVQGDLRGSVASDEISWYADNSGIDPMEIDDPLFAAHPAPVGLGTREVALKEPNPWGLYDMLGNVYEWCADAIEYGAPCATEPQRDPIGLVGPERAQRGEGWNIDARYARAAFRSASLPEERRDNLGLRLAADVRMAR